MKKLLSLLALLAAAFPSRAQDCGPTWIPGEQGKTLTGVAYALTNFDPDGAGPLSNLLVAGGSTLQVDGYASQDVMAFDRQHWSPIGSGDVAGQVLALTVYNNELIAAGNFLEIGGVAASAIAKWNGTTWSPVGVGVSGGEVRCLAVYNNELYAGGTFTAANGPAFRIARWNGSFWSVVGGGMVGGTTEVNALLAFNGNLYAGGNFTQAGAANATNLASWNGTTWSALGNPDNTVHALGSFSGIQIGSARLFVGGTFNNIGGIAAAKCAVVRFDPINGNVWSALNGPVLSSTCRDILVRSSGVTSFQVNAVFSSSLGPFGSSIDLYRWNGTSWDNLNTGISEQSLANFNGQLTCGGSGTWPGAVRSYVNNSWVALGRGNPGFITALTTASGDAIAASTEDSGTLGSIVVQRRDSATGVWSQLGGVFSAHCATLVGLPDGNILAGGEFEFNTDSGQLNRIALWNGTQWAPLGTGITGGSLISVNAIDRMSNNDIIVGGTFTTAGGLSAANIARWNGFAWSAIGLGTTGTVYAVKVAANGDIYAGGQFATASGALVNNIARWNGTNWLPLGTGTNDTVYALEQLADNSIIASGHFTTAGGVPVQRIARWNGTAWSSLGGGMTSSGFATVTELRKLSNGDLIAAGNFENAGGTPADNIARWDGSTWHAMEEGIQFGTAAPSIRGMSVLGDGTIAVGGHFSSAGSHLSSNFAIWDLSADCCDSIDFNNDTSLFDPQDIEAFLSVYSEGPCIPAAASCNDIDFNNDTSVFDPCDINSFLVMYSEGPCTPCGA